MNAAKIIIENFIINHPVEAAQLLEQMEPSLVAEYLNDLSINRVLEIIKHMDRSAAARSIEYMDVSKAAVIIENLSMENTLILLRVMDEKFRSNIINKLPDSLAQNVIRLLGYPANCAAAYMDTAITVLHDDLTAEEALKIIKKESTGITLNLFIADRDQVYRGILPVQNLIISPRKNSIGSLKFYEIDPVKESDSIKQVLTNPIWQEYCSLPVVSNSGLLLGAVNLEKLRRLEKKKSKTYFSDEFLQTGGALGDLYRIAFLALFKGSADYNEKN